jgi:hypothetical protein
MVAAFVLAAAGWPSTARGDDVAAPEPSLSPSSATLPTSGPCDGLESSEVVVCLKSGGVLRGALADVSPEGGVVIRVGGGTALVPAARSDVARVRYAADSTQTTPAPAPAPSPLPASRAASVSIAGTGAPPTRAEPSSTTELQKTRVPRLALVGAYRQIDDVPSWSAGALVAIGNGVRGSGQRSVNFQLEVRALAGRTGGGLATYEADCGATVEFVGGGGLFGAVGGGLALLDVPRATRHGDLRALGLEAHARVGYHVGYRFGASAPLVALDLDGQLYLGSYVVGPSLIAGYTF